VILSPTVRRIGPALLFFVLVAVVITACLPGSAPTGSGAVPSPSYAPPLEPATPQDPLSLIAWIFTPLFQVMLIILLAVYQFLENLGLEGAIAWAIVVLTLIVRAVLIPLYRKQLVSQRRM
jgi:membrane protein insertase Oxa1/YidC/SpoIIIJ